MVKKLFLCALACIAFTTAVADEGMWLPSLIKERVKDTRKVGFKLKASDIYSDEVASLKDAVMQFGTGSGSSDSEDEGAGRNRGEWGSLWK